MPNTKTLIVGAAVIVGAFIIYQMFFGGSATTDTTATS